MPLSDERKRRLIARYMARQELFATAGGEAMRSAFLELGSLDESDIARFRDLVQAKVSLLSQQAAATTRANLSIMLDERVVGVAQVVEPDWRGPFTRAWGALGRGESFEGALEAGATRADASGRDAVVSSGRQANRGVSSSKIDGWRRIPDANACEWCVLVSDQIYHTAATADFGHDRCGCAVVPNTR